MSPSPLKLCLVDMNNGVANEATRCFRRIFEAFVQKAKAANPGLETTLKHVQPRNLGELPDREVDLVLSSGGPGSPYDGYEEPWCTGYRNFLDSVVERNRADHHRAPKVFVVCHSFELNVLHFGVGKMRQRPGPKFGLMPAYMTDLGQRHPLYQGFDDRLFAFEHRNWEAVELDETRLKQLGGQLLARESRPGRTDKGEALLSFEFAPGILGTQFHPEADRPGVVAWIHRPEKAEAFKEAYGQELYERMLKSLDDPARLAKTFALLIPGWLTRQFNLLAPQRGWKPVEAPQQDMRQFEMAV
jgi:GMP synthase-like glutamine amidotransferase